MYFRNVYAQGNNGGTPYRLGGGFGFYWERGSVSTGGGGNWGYAPLWLDTVQQGFGANSQQLASIISMDKTFISLAERCW